MKTLASILLPLVLLGAPSTPDPDTVTAMARKAPAEFAADAMIRVASNAKLDARTRVKLLTEAFRLAGGAQHPLKLRGAITRSGSDGAFLERAYRQELDTLSLRLRAVREMLPLDGAKASKLFFSIPRPAVPPVHCEEIVVYDVDLYYDGLGAIAKLGHRDLGKLLKERVGGITSPAQVAPVARLLRQAGLNDADLRKLTDSFATRVSAVAGDDRSFTYYATAAAPAIQDLVEELKRRNLPALPLAEAFRKYLVSHLSGDRCADGHLIYNGPLTVNVMTGQPVEVIGSSTATFFKDRIMMPPLTGLTEQETTPNSLKGVAAGAQTCTDDQCKHFNDLSRNLAFTSEGTPREEAERKTDAWRASLRSALTELEAWQPGKGQTADDLFRDKTWVYDNLYAMAPQASRELVERSWIDYLKQSRSTVSDRGRWLLPVSALIGRSALDPANRKLAEMLSGTNDPVIALYIQVEALAPRDAATILSML